LDHHCCVKLFKMLKLNNPFHLILQNCLPIPNILPFSLSTWALARLYLNTTTFDISDSFPITLSILWDKNKSNTLKIDKFSFVRQTKNIKNFSSPLSKCKQFVYDLPKVVYLYLSNSFFSYHHSNQITSSFFLIFM